MLALALALALALTLALALALALTLALALALALALILALTLTLTLNPDRYFYRNVCHGAESWGGCAHSTLLLPGAYARSPLCARLPRLDYSAGIRKISFIYGGGGHGHHGDWMDYRHALALQAETPASDSDGAGRRLPVEVARVAGAGHNVMADNPIGFAEAVASSGQGLFDGHLFGERACILDVAERAAGPEAERAAERAAEQDRESELPPPQRRRHG